MKLFIRRLWNNNNFISLLGNLIFAFLGFLSFLFLARSYNLSDFGKYMIYVSGGTFIEMIRFGITRTSVVKFLSGCSGVEYKSFIGASWAIGLVITIGINMLMWIALFIIPDKINSSGFSLFWGWYPFLAIVNLPFNNAISILQAGEKFKKLLIIKLLSVIIFFVYITLNFFFFHLTVQATVVFHIASQLITSLACIALRWDGLDCLFYTRKKELLRLLHFGKFSIGTLLSTSLLKSADTFILGIVPFMGASAVAVYSIPLKLTELLEIPLRSFVATVFPRMSKAHAEGNTLRITGLFYDYAGMVTLLFIPIVIACWVFAPLLVMLLGGGKYNEAVWIFRIYIVYGLFLPIDRFSGIALDSIGVPKYNLYKVLLMAAINIVGDFIVIYAFRSMECVASISILVTFIGALMGYNFYSFYQKLHVALLSKRGWKFLITKIRHNVPF